jgi:hypothetical protein
VFCCSEEGEEELLIIKVTSARLVIITAARLGLGLGRFGTCLKALESMLQTPSVGGA